MCAPASASPTSPTTGPGASFIDTRSPTPVGNIIAGWLYYRQLVTLLPVGNIIASWLFYRRLVILSPVGNIIAGW